MAGLKSTSYGENVVALAFAKQRGGSEAIFANTRGELCEGTGSNVFIVSNGELITPPLEGGCLADNIASRRLLERCGFKYEGVAQAFLQIDGQWRDHVIYALLRADRIDRGRD